MTEDEAYDYLVECVADYIGNKYPLVYITGFDRGGPDPVHVAKLREALELTGWTQIAERLPKQYL